MSREKFICFLFFSRILDISVFIWSWRASISSLSIGGYRCIRLNNINSIVEWANYNSTPPVDNFSFSLKQKVFFYLRFSCCSPCQRISLRHTISHFTWLGSSLTEKPLDDLKEFLRCSWRYAFFVCHGSLVVHSDS